MKYSYATNTVFGGITAEGINGVIEGRNKLRRVKTAALVALGFPADYTKVEGGDFGAESGDGEGWFNTLSSALVALDAIVPASLEALDMGG